MKKHRLHLDIETYSESDLRKEGVYRYALHPSTDINIVCFAMNDGPVHVWLPWEKVPGAVLDGLAEGGRIGKTLIGKACPDILKKALLDPAIEIAAHNAQFERVVMNHVAGNKHWIPHIPIEKTVCTMAKAAVHGLPEALEHCAKALDTYPKSEFGYRDMLYLSRPRSAGKRKGTRPVIKEEVDRFIKATKYCIDDVHAERDIDKVVPDLTEREMKVYRLDQRINERGVKVDIESVKDAKVIVDRYKKRLRGICRKKTGCSPGQHAALSEWVRENGYPQLPNLQAPTVVEALADDKCPLPVKKILKLYSVHNMKAVSKLDAALRAACPDGRLRGMMYYYGAGPGRWSSRIMQLQNMMRPVIGNVDDVIDAMWLQDIDIIKELNPDVDLMKAVASCTRGMLIADEGKKLMAFDYAQIESRLQAWLSGAKWKLDFFRSDSKFKVYHITGSMMFGRPPEEIVDEGTNQLYTASKIGELACGYQGWEPAVEKMARQQGMKLTMSGADIAGRWRDANVEQVKTWAALSDAATWAVKYPGKAYAIRGKKAIFKVVGDWLYLRLPSGRRIAYYQPEVGKDKNGDPCATYMGVDTVTRRWMRVRTYGGRLMQNWCEGVGRDLLVNGLLNMEAAGYETIMSVHDEGVFEVDEDFGSEDEAERLMTVPLEWAEGLPVKCDGYTAKRYRK